MGAACALLALLSGCARAAGHEWYFDSGFRNEDGGTPQDGGGDPGAVAPDADSNGDGDNDVDAAPETGVPDAGERDGSGTELCTDGEQNGSETDIDCGGECSGCGVGKECAVPADCAAGATCTSGVCTEQSSPSFHNYNHGSYTYSSMVDWSCAGTTRFDSSGNGSWVQTTSCSDTEAERPELTCGVAQTAAGGPDVCILRARGLTIGASHTLELVGNRPVILAVEGDATIDGTVSADANGTTPGAGGNWSCGTSQGGDGSGSTDRFDGASGGGGGGFGTSGGAGGTANTDGSESPGGSPGGARGNTSLNPLLGGCAGGRAGGCIQSAGGAGGGAVQIAASGALVVRGTVRANGGAGATPCGADDEGGGTGGGAGGGILLEGGSVTTTGAILQANGGAGGRNGSWAGIYNCGGSAGGSGASDAAQDGDDGRDCQGGGSGGGGGYGRIVTSN